jgi:hypothetical protein
MSNSMVDGYPRAIWWNADGETVVESTTITDMAHGTPLGVAANDERYGAQGAFMIEAGISSSYHIAGFFGLTDRVDQPRPAPKQTMSVEVPTIIAAAPAVFVPPSVPELNALPWPLAVSSDYARSRRPSTRPAIDVGEVITRALTAAGLMK